MMQMILCGAMIGIFSLIPGISSGTVLVMLHQFEHVAEILSQPRKNIKQLLLLLFGIAVGVLSMGRIIEFCFQKIPCETLFFFGGIVLFGLPKMMKHEKKGHCSPLFFAIGFLLILLLAFLSGRQEVVITSFPNISILFLVWFMLCGAVDGALTIFPGISGSMTMMVLGPYYLYKSYIANVSFAHLSYLVPLIFYFLGDLIGLFLGSKASLYLLKHYRDWTMSLIYGMILSSALVILPLATFPNLFTAGVALLLAFLINEILTLTY